MSTSDEAVARMSGGYGPIIRRFVSGEVSADEFESSYLSYFKRDKNRSLEWNSTFSTACSPTSMNTLAT
jgi:hypothetical protein